MLTQTSRWSHARGNTVVPSRWQATQGGTSVHPRGPTQHLGPHFIPPMPQQHSTGARHRVRHDGIGTTRWARTSPIVLLEQLQLHGRARSAGEVTPANQGERVNRATRTGQAHAAGIDAPRLHWHATNIGLATFAMTSRPDAPDSSVSRKTAVRLGVAAERDACPLAVCWFAGFRCP
jgi:hypothetical protein